MQVELLMTGLARIFTPGCLMIITFGVVLGIVFGSMPGLSATMAVALCLPISYGMEPIQGIALLVGLYVGGISGGLISAILINIPGTPSSVATCFDGAPMAAKGEAGKALGVGITFSAIGTLISVLALLFIAPGLAGIALKFGSYEYFAVGIFSLSLISSLVSGSVLKGIASAVIGLCLAMAGAAPIDAFPRFTFGISELDGGFNILPVLIGLFAVSEILFTAEKAGREQKMDVISYKKNGLLGFTWPEFVSQIPNAVRSALIGIGIGILPGIGGGTSNMLSYVAAKKQSKYPEKFGTGIIDGIVASETANNAGVGGALIPLLSLGIPGDTTTAMLLGGLTIHGLTPGPLLFKNNGPVVYSIFAAVFVATLIMLVLEYGGLRLFTQVIKVPKHILLPIVMVLCVVGAFGVKGRIFDVACILVFGILGVLFAKFKFPNAPMILGFILCPMIETNLRRGIQQSKGSLLPFITRPISCLFLCVGIGSLVWGIGKAVRQSKNK
ncbi:MAG: tripartite tricarboxylate transporter permease [Clostridiaceae bacterium]|nr:tripartite tricarboxylate transporter permease [Clostridiaceae bacterium]